ncbi:MAG: fibronectin type III domain-containing protein [Nitrospiraceae bacterium]|nr:fibronectin type III domain-containing protein [Nitrospiraceae bacterium]
MLNILTRFLCLLILAGMTACGSGDGSFGTAGAPVPATTITTFEITPTTVPPNSIIEARWNASIPGAATHYTTNFTLTDGSLEVPVISSTSTKDTGVLEYEASVSGAYQIEPVTGKPTLSFAYQPGTALLDGFDLSKPLTAVLKICSDDASQSCDTKSVQVTFEPFVPSPPPPAPAAPTGVSAVAGDGQVNVSWQAVTGATSYNVYSSTVSGVTVTNGTRLSVSASPCAMTGLTDGTTYYFVVTAVSDAGESAASAQVSATPFMTTLAPPSVQWTLRTAGTNSYLVGVAWGNNQFVAVGSAGIIVTSPSGSVWTPQASGSTEDLQSVAWSGAKYVAVGGWYGNILTSPDGLTWTKKPSGVNKFLRHVIWENNQFVAVGTDTIMTSLDGDAWTPRVTNAGKEISNVAWNGSKFVAIGGSNGSICFTSPDGATWTQQTSMPNAGMLFGLAASNAMFVTTGWGGTILSSPDGVTWTSRTSDATTNLSGVVWTGGYFFAAGAGGAIIASADGVNWLAQATGTLTTLNDIAWNGSTLVAVGGTTTKATILTSP